MSANSILDKLRQVFSDTGAGGKLFGFGTVVPVDGAAGWALGAVFIHTDGSGASDLLYQNIGTVSSCNFDSCVGTSADFASGITTDTITERTGSVGVSIAGVTKLLKVDTIAEGTSNAGVTCDGVKLKDSEPYCDAIREKTQGQGVSFKTAAGLAGTIKVDTIAEYTSDAGVVVDGVICHNYGITLGNTASAGVLGGCGAEGATYTMAGASASALSFHITSASTADSNRAIYARLYLTGAAGGGEAGRFYTTVAGVGSPAARGAHISVGFTGSGTVTGESMAVKGTYMMPSKVQVLGTSSCLCAEVYAEGTQSSASGVLALFAGKLSGDATGVAILDNQVFLMDLDVGANAAGTMFSVPVNCPSMSGFNASMSIFISYH